MSLLHPTMHPAYHLRPNKAVDRFIFLEILRTFELYHPLNKHIYVGFGGPFLEDFRLISQLFPDLDLISIEKDRETHKRQEFHKCSNKLRTLPYKFEEFLTTEFPSDRPVIVWLDYTDFNRQCLLETADVTRRVNPLSIIRITVKAENYNFKKNLRLHKRIPLNLPRNKKSDFEKYSKEFREQMSIDGISYDHDWFTWEKFRNENYPIIEMQMLRAVLEGSCSSPKVFVPLHAAKYSDGTIMLSLTGIFCQDDNRDKILQHFKSHCSFHQNNDDTIDEIDVPQLTTKERLWIEKRLPTHDMTGQTCLKALGYLIEGDNSYDESLRKMMHYEKYYRLYPYFGKVIP